jgi:sugar phosphate isomerase/epimerase
MKITRRDFIMNSVLLGTGILASSKVSPAMSSFPVIFEPQLGVCTGVNDSTLLSTLGYSYIEEGVRTFLVPEKTDNEFMKNLVLAMQSTLPVKACNSFLPGEMKSVGPEADHAAILKYAETAFCRARKAGVEIIVFGSSGSRKIPEGFSRDESRSQFISLCSNMAPIADKYKITIVLEPLNSGECNFINSVAEGGEIVKAVDHPSFKLLADIYHMKVENENPGNIIKYGQFLRHVHIAEKEGRSAPGSHGEDFSPYFKALKSIGYKGCISVECKWLDLEKQAPLAIKTINKQLGKI